MRVMLLNHSKEGHIYLIRLHTSRLIKRTKLLLNENRDEAVKGILTYGQLEKVVNPNLVGHIDADLIINCNAVFWNLMKHKDA